MANLRGQKLTGHTLLIEMDEKRAYTAQNGRQGHYLNAQIYQGNKKEKDAQAGKLDSCPSITVRKGNPYTVDENGKKNYVKKDAFEAMSDAEKKSLQYGREYTLGYDDETQVNAFKEAAGKKVIEKEGKTYMLVEADLVPNGKGYAIKEARPTKVTFNEDKLNQHFTNTKIAADVEHTKAEASKAAEAAKEAANPKRELPTAGQEAEAPQGEAGATMDGPNA